jgi:LMBR1-like membrane protein
MAAHLELVVIEFVILAIVCFFLIRYYKGKMVTIDVAAVVYLSWVLGFAGILLLPYDISVAVVDGNKSVFLDNIWNFIYWRSVYNYDRNPFSA